jgi:hypothetical protein
MSSIVNFSFLGDAVFLVGVGEEEPKLTTSASPIRVSCCKEFSAGGDGAVAGDDVKKSVIVPLFGETLGALAVLRAVDLGALGALWALGATTLAFIVQY